MNTSEAGLHTVLSIKTKLSARELVGRALIKGCAVAAMEDYYLEPVPEEYPRLILYFSKIPASELRTAVRRLKEAWFAPI